MKSIMQDDPDICYLCGEYARGDGLDWHHVFGAALKPKSEKYGLKVRLHHNQCHIFGKKAIHKNKEIADRIKAEAQTIAMERYGWTLADWMKLFYKNYRKDIK